MSRSGNEGLEGEMKGPSHQSRAGWSARLLTSFKITAAAFVFAPLVLAPLVSAAPAGAQESRRQDTRTAPGGAPGGGRQTAPAGDGGQLEKRLDRIEEQLVDMHGQIGAIESLARPGAAAAPDAAGGGYGGGGTGDMASRVQGLETQLQVLSNQMNEILDRLSRLDGRSGGVRNGLGQRQGAYDPRGGEAPPAGEGRASGWKPASGPSDSGPGGFGETTIQPTGPEDRQDEAIPVGPAADRRAGYGGGGQQGGGAAPGRDLNMRQRFAATPQAGRPEPARASSPEAHRAYDQAYGLLVARDFQGATEGFARFLQSYPDDGMAGSAQYWLGQASFELGEYRKAADMFLKGFTNYPKSEKAPESLLKLGVALKRLNEKDAACDSFAELTRRFPQAPQAVLDRAEQEKRRTGCPS